MKINSTVFIVIAISLVGIVSYYIVVSSPKGNPHQPIQTSIEKEHSTTPKMVLKQTEATETKIDSQNVPTGQPNRQTTRYENNTIIVSKGKYGEPLLTGRGTDIPSANPVLQRTILPPPPKTIEDDVSFRAEAFNAMALAMYHRDLANAGDDESLQSIAQQNYILNQSKISAWQRNIENKFRLIENDENLDRDEKNLLKEKIFNRAGDQIYVSDQERLRSEQILNKQSLDELAQQQQEQQQEMMNQLDDIEWQQQQQQWQQQWQQRKLTNRLDDMERKQRWNNMERDNWQLKYNYLDNKWQYAPQNSQLRYNGLDNSWQYVPSP